MYVHNSALQIMAQHHLKMEVIMYSVCQKQRTKEKKNVNGCPKVNLVDGLFGIHFLTTTKTIPILYGYFCKTVAT